MNHSIYSADRSTHLKIVWSRCVQRLLWRVWPCHSATRAATDPPMLSASLRPENPSW
jgi:hypothetical protein